MSSDELKKDKVIQAKKFYLEEEIYLLIINGFESAKERELVDKKNMPVMLRVLQLIRLKLSSPYMFGGFFKAEWFNGIFEKEYQVLKKKKMKDIRLKFYYAWYDLEKAFSLLLEELLLFLAEKDKDKHHLSFWKVYKNFKRLGRISRFIQSVKLIKHTLASKRLFLGDYNLINLGDYRRFLRDFHLTVQDVLAIFVPAILKFIEPSLLQIRYLYDRTLNNLYTKFIWHAIKSVLVGTAWYEIVLTVAAVGVSVLSVIFSYGTAAVGVGAAWLARIMQAVSVAGRNVRTFAQGVSGLKTISKGLGALRIGKAIDYGAKGLRATSSPLMRKGVNVLSRGKNWFAGTRAFGYTKTGRYLVFTPLAQAGKLGLFFLSLNDTHYDAVKDLIYKKSLQIYRKLLALYLIDLKHTANTISDLSNIASGIHISFGNGDLLYNGYLKYRTNKEYGIHLRIPISWEKDNAFFVALNIITLHLKWYNTKVFLYLSNIDIQFSKMFYNVEKAEKNKTRYIATFGNGKFGIALYKEGKRLLFENINFEGNKTNKKFYQSILFDIDDKVNVILNGKNVFQSTKFDNSKRPIKRIKDFTWTFYSLTNNVKKGFTFLFLDNVVDTSVKKDGYFYSIKNNNFLFIVDLNRVLFSKTSDLETKKSIIGLKLKLMKAEKDFSKEIYNMVVLLREKISTKNEEQIEVANRKDNYNISDWRKEMSSMFTFEVYHISNNCYFEMVIDRWITYYVDEEHYRLVFGNDDSPDDDEWEKKIPVYFGKNKNGKLAKDVLYGEISRKALALCGVLKIDENQPFGRFLHYVDSENNPTDSWFHSVRHRRGFYGRGLGSSLKWDLSKLSLESRFRLQHATPAQLRRITARCARLKQNGISYNSIAKKHYVNNTYKEGVRFTSIIDNIIKLLTENE